MTAPAHKFRVVIRKKQTTQGDTTMRTYNTGYVPQPIISREQGLREAKELHAAGMDILAEVACALKNIGLAVDLANKRIAEAEYLRVKHWG